MFAQSRTTIDGAGHMNGTVAASQAEVALLVRLRYKSCTLSGREVMLHTECADSYEGKLQTVLG